MGPQNAIEATEEDLAVALARSEIDVLQQESNDVQKALVRSKAEVYRATMV